MQILPMLYVFAYVQLFGSQAPSFNMGLPCACLLQHFWCEDVPRFCSVLPALNLFSPLPQSLPNIYTSTK